MGKPARLGNGRTKLFDDLYVKTGQYAVASSNFYVNSTRMQGLYDEGQVNQVPVAYWISLLEIIVPNASPISARATFTS